MSENQNNGSAEKAKKVKSEVEKALDTAVKNFKKLPRKTNGQELVKAMAAFSKDFFSEGFSL